MMSLGLFIFCVLGFSLGLLMLIAVVREVKEDPTAAGIAVYGGGLCLFLCALCGLGIISFIIERFV